MSGGQSTDGSERSRRVKNPITGKREKLDELSRNGYKYHYLKLLKKHRRLSGRIQNAVELDGGLNFDKDKWELREREGAYRIEKKDPDSDRVMELLAFDYPTQTSPAQFTRELVSEDDWENDRDLETGTDRPRGER